MLFDKRPTPVIQPDPFPHAVTHHKAAVIDTDQGLKFGDDPAIDVDLDGVIPEVVFGLVSCHLHHGPLLLG